MTATATTIIRRRRNGGRRAVRALGWLFLVAALCVAGWMIWEIWGTSFLASKAATEQLERFYAENGTAPDDDIPLHTDFNLYPPPFADMHVGGTWGVLHVPSWRGVTGVYGETLDGLVPIAEGTTNAVLNKGWAAHFRVTAGVGQQGNFALAGHRRTYGQNFLRVPELVPGYTVAVETPQTWYIYEVMDGSPHMVGKYDTTLLAPVPGDATWSEPPTDRVLTLYTCTGRGWYAYENSHRAIVNARLVGWVERDAGTPAAVRS